MFAKGPNLISGCDLTSYAEKPLSFDTEGQNLRSHVKPTTRDSNQESKSSNTRELARRHQCLSEAT